MFKNYFYLRRAVSELNPLLQNGIITEAYSQERDKLYLAVGNSDFPQRHLILSTDTSMSYLTIKNEHYKAKKNAIKFFDDFLPDKLLEINIADNDRVIKIILVRSVIYFFVRGSRTNVMLVDKDGKILNFKRIKNQNEIELRDELMRLQYIGIGQLSSKNHSSQSHISKEIKIEADSRNCIDTEDIIQEIIHEPINVFYSNEISKPVMCPCTFKSFNVTPDFRQYTNYIEAVNCYMSLKYRNENIELSKHEIGHFLNREIEKLSSKLNDLKNRLENGSKEMIYKSYGNMLLANIHRLKKGMAEVELIDYVTNEKVKVKLDPKLSPQKMIDYYFNKSRGERINYQKSIELFEKTKDNYDNLLTIRTEFEESESLDDYIKIKKILKLGAKEKLVKQMDIQIRHRHYLIENKYHVYIGRDNVNNDLLTIKFAKQNDYWFHARGVPGSHVVLRVDNPKEGIPRNILKAAASLAAFYSKAKTSGTAPVSYTFRKYVHKKKGLEPGQVILSKESVLLVKPEIPQNSQQIDE